MADGQAVEPALVDSILERIAAAVNADRATLSRVDGDAVVIEGGFDRAGASLDRGSRWQITSPAFRRLVEHAEPLVQTYDAVTLPSPLRDQLGGVRHTATVPLLSEDRVIGAIAASRRDDRPFDAADVTTLRQLGNTAVLALRNSMLADLAQAAHSELRTSEERFRLLVEGVKDYAIFMLNPAGQVTSWNQGAERIKGYRTEEIIGHHFSIFYRDEDVAAGEPARALSTAQEQGRFEAEGWRRRKDGSLFWANVVITALRDERDRLRGFAKVTRDITERKRIQDQLLESERREAARFRELADQVAKLERAKSEFLKLASHELRTPVSLIHGYLSLFEEGDLGELNLIGKRAVSVLTTQVRELTFLIEQMLEAARLEQGSVKLDLEHIDLRDIAERAVDWARGLANEGHALALSLPDHQVLVSADRGRLSTVVRSLLDNAIKYSPEGGQIVVEVHADLATAYVVIKDDGLGIDPDQLDHLFRPFGRIVTDRTADIGGAGLGLYLARELVRLQGGDITADSNHSHGSTFTLAVPLASQTISRNIGRSRRPARSGRGITAVR
jgi:PAS domain S-box-containing protein